MQGEIKRNAASLVGGILIAGFVGVLAFVCLRQLGYSGPVPIVAAAVIGTLAGGYVRLADL